MNANTIIGRALRDLMVVPSGGTPTASQYADGLALLNDMLNEWSASGDLIYEDTREELSISAGTSSFTIGPTGDQVSTRPLELISHTLKDSSNYEYPLRYASDQQFNRFQYKSATSRPNWIHLRKTVPDSTIYFDSLTDVAYTLILTSMKALTTFPDGTTDISLPEHYSYALRSNLVVEGAPMFGAAKRVTGRMNATAERTKAVIIGDAFQLSESTTELSSGGSYDIQGDTWN